MSHEHHSWGPEKLPPANRPHSSAKHRVLRKYLERYVSVLTSNVKIDQLRLTLVDGFAGGGRFRDIETNEDRPGSPLVMLEAMEEAEKEAQRIRQKPFNLDVQYIFVEKNPSTFEYLTKVLQ